MLFNWIVIPTLLASYGLFCAGNRIAQGRPVSQKIPLYLAAVFLALPGVLIAIYYLHLFDSWTQFYEFRSWRGSECAAAGMGFLGGLIAAECVSCRVGAVTILGVLMTLGIMVPHAKPVLSPANWDQFERNWDGAVCKQSTAYSCGAACAATLLRWHGIDAEEKELAKACFTYSSGTENWYIARELRARGLSVRFHTGQSLEQVELPCLAGVRVGGIGHFVVILAAQGDSYLTGAPLVGARSYSKAELDRQFVFTGFFMSVHAQSAPQAGWTGATSRCMVGKPLKCQARSSDAAGVRQRNRKSKGRRPA